MQITRAEAYEILELPIGADPDSIRANYKRLVSKWHPEKNPKNLQEASKKFQMVSIAYKRLIVDGSEEVHLTLPEMFEQFRQVFYPKAAIQQLSNGCDDSADDSSSVSNKHMKDNKERSPSTERNPENSAMSYIDDEEKDKKKIEKRRARKKKRREKKRLEKQTQSSKNVADKQATNEETDTSDDDEEGCNAEVERNHASGDTVSHGHLVLSGARLRETNETNSNNGMQDTVDQESIILQSRRIAMEGNTYANSGDYKKAIDCFTEAIRLDSRDHRFFGNRSYCFNMLQQYDKALKDAEKTIIMAPDWAKGYFRKGRALAGLKLYSDSEQAFLRVLQLDHNCPDAIEGLVEVRTYQLMEMGFSRAQASEAIKQHGTVNKALDALLSSLIAETNVRGTFTSNNELQSSARVNTSPPTPPVLKKKAQVAEPPPRLIKQKASNGDSKMDPNNPEGLTALWVGNVLPTVTEKMLLDLFSKQGAVTSIRLIPDKFCAFVNFKNKEGAGKALKLLQGVECAGQHLKIKFPDHPISAAKKTHSPESPQQQSSSVKKLAKTSEKSLGMPASVNGDECYYWRTTGCIYGMNCRYRHLAEHRGIDNHAEKK